MEKDLRTIHVVKIIIFLIILLLQQLTLGYFLCAWLCSKFMHIDLLNLHSNSMKLLLLLSSSCA